MKKKSLSEKNSSDETSIFEISKNWLTAVETAQYLRTTVNAIRIAVHRKQIRARKYGKKLLFKKAELDELIETSFY